MLVNNVTITRKHTWNDKDLQHIKQTLKKFGYNEISDTVMKILGGGINKTVIKIYVPSGSKFIDSSGINNQVFTRSDDDTKKTYFTFEMKVSPGGEEKIGISYQLPQNLQMLPVDSYKLFVQSQPAINQNLFKKTISFKPGLQSYRAFPSSFEKDENGNLHYENRLKKDIYLSSLVGN